MNYVILLGIALYFVVMAVRDGAHGWNFGNGSMNFRIADRDYALRLRGDGAVDLAADGSGVLALDSGGSFEVLLSRNGLDRRVLYTSEGGTIAKQFFVGGNEQPWGADADRFVAEVMPIVLRETAINVDGRVAWLIANRGQAGLLAEIDLIRSDFAQRAFTVEYAQTAEIADADFQRLMAIAKSNMSSDFDLRTTLAAVFDAQAPAGESFVALLDAGETISSDFDARTLLEHVARRMPSTSEAAAEYIELARTISSDFDMRLALQPLMTSADAADDFVASAMDLAGRDISSDFDLRTLLAEAAPRIGASDALARAYTSATRSISSDFDQREALSALGRGATLTPQGWRLLLAAARDISSDFDAATLLVEIAPSLPNDDGVREAYRETLETIGNDFEYGRAAGALRRAGG